MSEIVYSTPENRPDDSEINLELREAESFADFIFILADKYGIPVTNNEERWQDGQFLREIGEFTGELVAGVEKYYIPGDDHWWTHTPHTVVKVAEDD